MKIGIYLVDLAVVKSAGAPEEREKTWAKVAWPDARDGVERVRSAADRAAKRKGQRLNAISIRITDVRRVKTIGANKGGEG